MKKLVHINNLDGCTETELQEALEEILARDMTPSDAKFAIEIRKALRLIKNAQDKYAY